MRTRPTAAVVTALAALLLAGAAPPAARAADEEAYAIKLSRPAKVGDQFHVDAVGAIRTKTVVRTEGEAARTINSAYGVSVDGTVKVLEVNAQGMETKLALTVTTCNATAGGKQIPMFKEGTVITAEWDKEAAQTKYSVDGKPVPDSVGEALGLVLNVNDPEGIVDDEIFGSKQPRRVGDVWAINAAAAAKELDRIGLKAKEEDLWGETTLAEATKTDAGEPALRMKTQFKARSMSGGGRRPDNPMKVESGSMTVATTVTLPVDPAKPPARDETKVTIATELAGKNDDGKVVKASRSVEREAERTIKPVGGEK